MTITRPLCFATARCRVGPVEAGDSAAVARLFLDAEVRRYLGGPVPEDRATAAAGQMRHDRQDAVARAIRMSDRLIGLLFLAPHHGGPDRELSYKFTPDVWGQGLATEVLTATIEAAFAETALPYLVAETQGANAASRRVLEKVGMQETARFERFGAMQVLYRIARPG